MKGKITVVDGEEELRLLKNKYTFSAIVKEGIIRRGKAAFEGVAILLLGVKKEDLEDLFVD